MKREQIVDLVVNWLNETKVAKGEAKLAPTLIAGAFCLWLYDKGLLRDVPYELLRRPDLEEAAKKESEQLTKIFNTIAEDCKNIADANKG